MTEPEHIPLGNGYFLSLERPEQDLSSCPANITKIIERAGDNSWSPGWIVLLVGMIFIFTIFFIGMCGENYEKCRSRRQLIKELRNAPSYELNNKLERLYENEIGFKTERLRCVDRYPDVRFGVDRVHKMRVVTVVENLEWVMPVDKDIVMEEESLGLVDNEGEEDKQEKEEAQEKSAEEEEVESETPEWTEETEDSEGSEQGCQPPRYIEVREPTAADRNINP
jgi:hypothetical protein